MQLLLLLWSIAVVAGAAMARPHSQAGSELMSRCFGPNEVALTFEGGPDAAKTPLVLDALRRHNATATFFLRAVSLDGWPAIQVAKRIAAEGHTVGLLLEPTMEQRDDISVDVLASSIANHIDIIDKVIGKRPKFLRANYANTTLKFGSYLNSNGYICTIPGIDVQDTTMSGQPLVGAQAGPLRAIINELPRQSSPIIRLHDTAPLTANMAKDIIEYLKVNAGKRLVDIVNCTGMAYAYDQQSSGKEDGKAGGEAGDRPLDMDGHLFEAPKPKEDPKQAIASNDGVMVAPRRGYAVIVIGMALLFVL